MPFPSSPDLDRQLAEIHLSKISEQVAENALQKEFIAKKLADLKDQGYDRRNDLLKALSQGLALRLEDEFLNHPDTAAEDDSNHPPIEPQIRAQQLMDELTSNEKFFESFRLYITGLRWTTDLNNFVGFLFIHGTAFDAALLDERLEPRNITSLSYDLGLPPPPSIRDNNVPVLQILKEHPALDYRRLLNDPFFAQSPEGIRLASAYQRLCGQILHEDYKDSRTQVLPQIPLSKFPIVEALIIDDVKNYGPSPKYSFGANPWIEAIWQSDSDKAQDTLSSRINTRLPVGERNAFDGPTEFEFKRYAIRNLRHTHDKEAPNNRAHNQLKKQLFSILAAYTSKGPIATSVREEDNHRIGEYENREVGEVKRIVSQILESLLVSGDPEEREIAETVMNYYTLAQGLEMPIEGQEEVLVKKDCLVLKKEEQQILLINALLTINENTDPSVFERMAINLFGPANAARLRQLAEKMIEGMPYTFPLSEEVKQKRQENRNAMNLFLIEQLEEMSSADHSTRGGGSIFEDFVKKTYLPESGSRIASEEYQRLIVIGKNPNLTAWKKSAISYRITEQMKYRKFETPAELKQVLLDLLEIYLGPQTLPASGLVGYIEGNYPGHISEIVQINPENIQSLAEDEQFRQEVSAYQGKVEIALSKPANSMGTITLERAKRLLDELLSK